MQMDGPHDGDEDADAPAGYASPPCYMHEIDPVYMGLSQADDATAFDDVMRWRKAERKRLLAARLDLPPAERRLYAARIVDHLSHVIGAATGKVLSLYWPIKGEPDLRPLAERLSTEGVILALPVVTEKARPLEFHRWQPGAALKPGFWNIPVPEKSDPVTPDILLAPVVGFDAENYRLGYGGGYFDRTLAAIGNSPRVIGVGYANAALRTIYPQRHDIVMDMIVTEEGASS